MTSSERQAVGDVFPELLAYAHEKAPEEMCGLLEWDGARLAFHACRNIAEEPERSFLIAPDDQIAVLALIEAAGTEFWGIAHSHARQGAAPSERDREFARYVAVNWIIIGLEPEEAWVGRP